MSDKVTATVAELTAADGHTFDCWMVPAAGKSRGGLVILQEIFGVTDQLKRLATHYAGFGLDVGIPALFDRQERGAVVPFDQGPRGRELMLALRLDQTMTDIDATVASLSENGNKVCVLGFCWGGGLAIRAAQTLDIAGAIAFYGTRLPQYLDRPLKAPLMGHFGNRDESVPQDMLQQAKTYLPEFEIHLYDAGHAFANDARPTYVADAANLAHRRTEEFLAKHLG